MKAVVIDHDSPGHVTIKEIDNPMPAPNEALVKVAAVSLNLGEVRYAQKRDPGSQIGWDLAGTVEQPAASGEGPKAGARVAGFLGTGAWAELAAVPVDRMAELPENVSFTQAATLPVAGLTALYVLEHGHGLLGRKVLVTGANGGVGMFSCQLAKMMGAKVIGQVRRDRYRDLVLSWGADEVVVSEDAGAACEYGPYRLISESVGGAVLSNCLAMLDKDGICVSFGTSAGSEVTFDASSFYASGRASLYGFLLFNELGREPASVGLARLVALVADGRLKPHITVEEPCSRIGDVVQRFWDRKIPGKTVVHIS